MAMELTIIDVCDKPQGLVPNAVSESEWEDTPDDLISPFKSTDAVYREPVQTIRSESSQSQPPVMKSYWDRRTLPIALIKPFDPSCDCCPTPSDDTDRSTSPVLECSPTNQLFDDFPSIEPPRRRVRRRV